MARAPRAHVPKTSGQGVSRLSYQRGYALAHKGDAPKISSPDRTKMEKPGLGKSSGGRTEYGKAGKSSGAWIAPYTATELSALKEFGRDVRNRSSVKLEPGEVKKLR